MLLTIYVSLFFIHVAVVACKIWEIPRKLELIGLAVQGHPRSSVLVPIESEHSNLLLATLIVTLDVSLTVFEILTNKARKWVVFPPLLCLTSPLGETCQNFWMKLTPQKQKDVATIWWKFHDPNFTDFSLIQPCECDGRAIAYSALCMLSRVKKWNSRLVLN